MKAFRRENVKREFSHGMRGETAKTVIGAITPGMDVMGLTKGDFSMIDILAHILDEVGESHIVIGTWTAGAADISRSEKFVQNSKILSWKMLVDRSFPNRQPRYFNSCCEKFGYDSIRLARFHAKFIMIKSGDFRIVVRTSMNLNENKRIEMFEITDNAEMYGYFQQIVDYHFSMPSEDSYNAFKLLSLECKPPRGADHNEFACLDFLDLE